MCFAPQRRALFRHFFDIWTSKSGTNMVCFVHFDLEMCFAPQRRALFRHRNFQKWSENGVLCTFWLQNVLRATTACTFSTSQLPKVVRSSSVLYILTSKCASRHNGVQFFISHLASWLRTRRFSEPTFRPSGATNHWKNTVFRDFPTFSRICTFFLLIFSLLTLFTSAFQLSILSEVSLLNFLRLYVNVYTHADTISRPSRWFHALPVPEPGQEEDICPICPKDTRHMVSIKREGQQNIIDRSLRRISRETNSFLELLKFLAIIKIHIYIYIIINNNKKNNNNNMFIQWHIDASHRPRSAASVDR